MLFYFRAYTAVSAAFLVVGTVGIRSLDDLVESNKKLCVNTRHLSALFDENPQLEEFTVPLDGANTTDLIKELLYGTEYDCDAIALTADAFKFASDLAIKHGDDICNKLSVLTVDLLFSLDVVFPTYELLDEYGKEFIGQVQKYVRAGAYAKIDAQVKASNEELKSQQGRRILRGGGAKGGASGGSAGGTDGSTTKSAPTNFVCASDEDADLDIFQLTLENLLMPITLLVGSTTLALLIHCYYKTKIRAKVYTYELLGLSFDNDDGTLLRHELNNKAPSQLIDELQFFGVEEELINAATDELPHKEALIELLYREKQSTYERDVSLISNLSILEMYGILTHLSQKDEPKKRELKSSVRDSVRNLRSTVGLETFNENQESLNDKDDPKAKLVCLLMDNTVARRLAVHLAKTKISLKDPGHFLLSEHLEDFELSKLDTPQSEEDKGQQLDYVLGQERFKKSIHKLTTMPDIKDSVIDVSTSTGY